jgi:endoglucanase
MKPASSGLERFFSRLSVNHRRYHRIFSPPSRRFGEAGILSFLVILAFFFIEGLSCPRPVFSEENSDQLKAVRADQVGYLPLHAKLAMVVSPQAEGSFQVCRVSDKKILFRGKLGEPQTDPDSGDTIRIADFTALKKQGAFFLQVPGAGESFSFRIASDVYRDAYYLAMRSYYGQRCGTKVDMGEKYPKCRHEACHMADAEFHRSSGKKGHQASLCGWHDAGDYGKYIVNSGISCGTLLLTYEWFPKIIGKTRLDIPESGDSVPDILDEIKWNLDWMFTMQDTDGGVWHKLTTEKFCGFVQPEDDRDTRYIIGTDSSPYKNTGATGDFAAVMAQAARVYRPFLPDYAGKCRKAAEKAWEWLKANPGVAFSNPSGVATGGYGDGKFGDEMLWASAELFCLTGEKEYNDYFINHYGDFSPSDLWPQAWPDVGNLGWWAYYFSGRKDADRKVREDIRLKTLKAADGIVEASAKVGYRHSLRESNYIWGSNSVAANFGIVLMVANRMGPKKEYVSCAMENLHYLLGRNTFDLCFVTRLGARSPKHIHHRPSEFSESSETWPGLLAGGPNRHPADPALRRLPASPPARCYTDDKESYASNEIAINWNAPLVFLLASTLPDETKSSKKQTVP